MLHLQTLMAPYLENEVIRHTVSNALKVPLNNLSFAFALSA